MLTGVPYVPESCCKNIMLKTCTGETFSNGPPTYGPPVTPNMTKNPYLKMKVHSSSTIVHAIARMCLNMPEPKSN